MTTFNIYRFQLAVFISSFLFWNSYNSFAYDPNDVILGVNSTNIGYLRYVNFENQFDSASVGFICGEIRIISGNTKQLIPISSRMYEEHNHSGNNAEGIDHSLMDRSQTNKFVYKLNSHIKFFRKLSANITKGVKPPFDPTMDTPDGEAATKKDYRWVVGKNKIKDRTEFLIELVKVNDPNSVYVIDSVGVDTNEDYVIAPRYGWKPDKVNHVRKLPDDFANQEVYIRIKPARFGRSDKSLAMKIIPHWVSLSVIAENDSLINEKVKDSGLMHKLINRFFNDALLYCDSVKMATGSLPQELPMLSVLTNEQQEILEKMFFDVKVVDNDTIITEKICKRAEKEEIELIKDAQKRLDVNHINCIPFSNSLNFTLNTKESMPDCTIKLYDYQYTFISNVWQGDLVQGRNGITIENLNLPRGVYLLQVNNSPNKVTISALIKR